MILITNYRLNLLFHTKHKTYQHSFTLSPCFAKNKPVALLLPRVWYRLLTSGRRLLQVMAPASPCCWSLTYNFRFLWICLSYPFEQHLDTGVIYWGCGWQGLSSYKLFRTHTWPINVPTSLCTTVNKKEKACTAGDHLIHGYSQIAYWNLAQTTMWKLVLWCLMVLIELEIVKLLTKQKLNLTASVYSLYQCV
jgi:hypothetical protein